MEVLGIAFMAYGMFGLWFSFSITERIKQFYLFFMGFFLYRLSEQKNIFINEDFLVLLLTVLVVLSLTFFSPFAVKNMKSNADDLDDADY